MPSNTNSIPLIFADGISNFANSEEIAKFYLYRLDPSAKDVTENDDTVVVGTAQVVMPLESAFEAAAFLIKAIEKVCVANPALAKKWEKAKADQAAVDEAAKK